MKKWVCFYNEKNLHINQSTMPKLFFIILLALGIVLGIILAIENMIGAVGTVYTLIWQTTTHELVFFTLICGAFIGYGLKGILSYSDDDENSERF